MGRALRAALEASPEGRAYLEAKKKAKRSKVARVRARPGVREAKDKKRATREERNDRAAAIRAAVFERAAGRCECCRSRCPGEWHHLISGPSRRREESVESTVAVCPYCHVDLHRNSYSALAAIRAHAKHYGYGAALAAIDKRIDKIEQARRTPTVPVRVETR